MCHIGPYSGSVLQQPLCMFGTGHGPDKLDMVPGAMLQSGMKQRYVLVLAALQESNLPQPLVVEAQAQPDPDFPTVVFPNPQPHANLTQP